MASVEESLFISQFLAAYAAQATKYPADYISPDLAPNWTSKRATFERPAKPIKAGAAQGDIQVTVKSLKSGQWIVDVPAQGTIADLKVALQDKAGIEVGAQRLVLKGKALVDNKKLEEYGLESGSVVHLFSKAGAATSTPAASSSATVSVEAAVSAVQDAGTTGTAGTVGSASVLKKPVVTSYRGLSEEATAIAREAEFWYWLNDQLKERLGSKEDASLMMKGFLGQYRDLIGNAGTKQIEKDIKK
ncbi:ubiquitin-related domain-containing protein [Dissophora ornata]|nr:hypothetical protein BGZ58_010235 [Dissophora ornata]KAI8603506.1 ubiquitin-related domain-containing protein [Dissophora ornata]